MDDQIKKLELRITELENQLKSAGGKAASIDPEEMKTFQKVSQQLGYVGCINECQPTICQICHPICHPICWPCYPCHPICSCGPCIISGPATKTEKFDKLG